MEEYELFAQEFPWFFTLSAGLFGAIVGSFLNVCIYRIPKEQSVVSPGSHCACGKPVAWFDNVPVLSWLILRGRARCCGRPFSFRYPFVELLTAAMFALCWHLFPAGKAVASMVLVAVVICAIFIDRDHMIIPDVFTIWAGVAGVLLSVALPSLHAQSHEIYLIAGLRSGLASVLGLMVGSSLVLWIALVAEAILKKDAMGFGDVKFLGALGAFVGWKGAVFAMFAGAMLGSLWFGLEKIWKPLTGKSFPLSPKIEDPEGKPAEASLNAHVSFGPMLGIAALAYLFGLDQWMDVNYFDQFKVLFGG
jgi:leader peptidase (prepilin peptidase) / N-methyltransferase